MLITRFELLFDGWRGYLLAFLALPFVANVYLGLFAQAKLEANKDRAEAKFIQHEAEVKAMEKGEKKEQRKGKAPAA